MTVRRPHTTDDGRESWALISQIEHARISGELAEAWHADVFASAAAREELIGAAFHHDDGWVEWEKRPGVDPELGQPRSFTEMPLADSLPIWRKSIEACEPFGPLAARTVAGHFTYLLRNSDMWEQRPSVLGGASAAPIIDEEGERQATAWLDEFDARRQEWLLAWQRQQPERHTAEAATDASLLLAMWDRISLWLCCSEATEPHEIETTTSEPQLLIPVGERQVELYPWPLKLDVYRPQVLATIVPVARYPSADAMAAAARREVDLSWELWPRPVDYAD